MRAVGVVLALSLGATLGPAEPPELWLRFSFPVLVDLVFLDEGRTLLVASGDGLELWDVVEARRKEFRYRPNIFFLATNPARTLVAVGTNRDLELWDPAVFAPIQHLSHPHVVQVQAAAISSSARLVAGYGSEAIVLWRAQTGEILLYRKVQDILGARSSVEGLAFLSEEELVVVTYPDLFVWDLITHRVKKIGEVALRNDKVAVDGRRRLVAFPATDALGRRRLKVMDVDTGQRLADLPHSLSSPAWSQFTPDGSILSPSSGPLGTGLYLFRAPTYQAECCFPYPAEAFPAKIALSRDGSRLAVVEQPFALMTRVAVYALEGCRPTASLGRWGTGTLDAKTSSDGRWLVRLSPNGLEVWDIQHLTLHRLLEAPAPWEMALHPKASVVALAVVYGQEVMLWNWETGARKTISLHLADPEAAFRHRAARLTFTPDGAKLAIVHWGGDLSLWDLASGRREWGVRDGEEGAWPAVSPDGRFILTIGRRGLYVRDAASGKVLDKRPWGATPEALFWIGENALLVNGATTELSFVQKGSVLWIGRLPKWHVVRLSSTGAIENVTTLRAPAGRGALLDEGRILAVLEATLIPEEPHRTPLLLWDWEEDRVIRRWDVDFVLAHHMAPQGGVVGVPGTRKVVLWNPMSSLFLCSLNAPLGKPAISMPKFTVPTEGVESGAEGLYSGGG